MDELHWECRGRNWSCSRAHPTSADFQGDTRIRKTEVKVLALLLIKVGFGRHGLYLWLKLASFHITPEFSLPTSHRQSRK